MKPVVKSELESLNTELVAVPANMTHFFQPLDLTVNGSAKKFMRKQFITYYSGEIKNQVDSGTFTLHVQFVVATSYTSSNI